MGVGLYLTGTSDLRSDDWLTVIEHSVRSFCGQDVIRATRSSGQGNLSLHVSVHPAAEPIDFVVHDPVGDGQQIVVSAKTSTVGPGYHAHLCELLHALTEPLSITWDPPDSDQGTGDETGYFFTADRAALEQQMLHWLSQVAGIMLSPRETYTSLRLSLPISPYYHGPEGALLLTSTGPRDEAWLRAVVASAEAGIDVFPWWEPGKGAAYELGWVRVQLWLDVRWHQAATDEEEALARDLLRRLDRAYRLDPTLDYPYAAWEEIYNLVIDADDDDLIEIVRSARDAAPAPGPLGYRAFDVDETLPGGFRITVPGSLSWRTDDDGTQVAWEGELTLWATAFTNPSGELRLPNTKPEGEPVEVLGVDPALRLRAHRSVYVDGDEVLPQITAFVAAPGRLLLLTLVVPDEPGVSWALAALASIRG